jgi:hypothetical protein
VRVPARAEGRRVGVNGDCLAFDTDAFAHRFFARMLPGAASRWARRLLPSAGRA